MKYVRLIKLVDDLSYTEDTEQWLSDIRQSGVQHGYTYAVNDDLDLAIEEFDSCELTIVGDIAVYDVMGSSCGRHSFFLREIAVYKHLNGSYYVEDSEDLGVF